MKYYVYACDQTYGGLHGMYNTMIVDVNSKEEAEEYIPEMSRDLMESYDCIFEDVYETDYETEEEYWEAYEEIIQDNIDGYVKKIKPEFEDMDIYELDKIACDLGPELFKEKYCET